MTFEPTFDPVRSAAVRQLLVNTAASTAVNHSYRLKGKARLVLGGAIVSTMALTGGALAVAEAGWIQLPCAITNCQPEYAEVTDWPVNAHGETYGVQGDSPVAPDLVRVHASNGKTGYVWSRDLEGPMPTSPEQALEWQRAQEGNPRVIDVYEKDGRTLIGSFRIGP